MRKTIILSLVAVMSVVLLVAVSAVAVYALAGQAPVQAETVEAAPALDAPVTYERASYAGKTGCSYKANLQMTERAPAEPAQEQLLTQAAP